jgi:hypothetical protein
MKRHGHWMGWAALWVVVGVADYYGDQSMSDAFKVLARDRRTRPVMILAAAYVNAHLFGVIPDRWDMFHRVRAVVRRTIPDGPCCSDVFEDMV